MELAIVITDFNGYPQTRRCLACLRQSHWQDFTVWVVDHGTTSETREGLARDFPEVQRLSGSPEWWWSAANNHGITTALAAGAQRVMLLNNDCYLPANALGDLMAHSKAQPEAIIAPVQRLSGSVQASPYNLRHAFLLGFPTLVLPSAFAPGSEEGPLLKVRLIVGGRGAIIPASVWWYTGLMDAEHLPHYGADHDFYLRAQAHGVTLYVAPGVCVEIDTTRTSLAATHDGQAMSWRRFADSLRNPRSHRNLRSIRALFRKHYPLPGFHDLGVALFLLRQFMVFALKWGHNKLCQRSPSKA